MVENTVYRLVKQLFKQGNVDTVKRLLQDKKIWDLVIMWLNLDATKRHFFDEKIRDSILYELALKEVLRMNQSQREAVIQIAHFREAEQYIDTVRNIERHELQNVCETYWNMDPGSRNVFSRLVKNVEQLREIIELDNDEKKIFLDVLQNPGDYTAIWLTDNSD